MGCAINWPFDALLCNLFNALNSLSLVYLYIVVFGKYQLKIRQNKITDDELDGLEDELIYSQA